MELLLFFILFSMNVAIILVCFISYWPIIFIYLLHDCHPKYSIYSAQNKTNMSYIKSSFVTFSADVE